MSACFFDVIDWQRQWLAPLLPAAMEIVQARQHWRQALNAAAQRSNLRNRRGLPIQFVAQSNLPAGVAYEAFINATGCVPTRDNAHDFFNALAWLTYPQLKSRLNALQAAEIARVSAQEADAANSHRGKLRDAATIFDENAALLVTRNQSLVDALRAHQWSEVFVTRRVEFERDCEIFLFGHALMEKLIAPYKAITAHVLVVPAHDAFFSLSASEKRQWLDAGAAQQIANGVATADFTPLPALGVPGWWVDQDASFYADTAVFRPKRSVKNTGNPADSD